MDWKVRRKWSKFEVYMKEHVFIFRNNCEVVKLLNVFHHKVFSVSFGIIEKKDYLDEKPFHLFWTPQLSLCNNFLNIFNKYNVLTLNKYTLE